MKIAGNVITRSITDGGIRLLVVLAVKRVLPIVVLVE